MEGKDKQEIEKRILLSSYRAAWWLCLYWLVFRWHLSPRAGSEWRPSAWPTSLLTHLHCKMTSDAEQLRSCSLQPALQQQRPRVQTTQSRGGVTGTVFVSPRSQEAFLLHLKSLHHSPSSLVSLDGSPEESTTDWWMKARNPFSNNRMMILLYAQKKKSLVASKGKLMSLTCIKHLNMCSKSSWIALWVM